MIETRPGQVLKITKMAADKATELGLDNERAAYAIVLDPENMMVFVEIEQRGYPGAKGGLKWASRVYPTGWLEEEGTSPAESSDVPDNIPAEFWPISARAGMNGGI